MRYEELVEKVVRFWPEAEAEERLVAQLRGVGEDPRPWTGHGL